MTGEIRFLHTADVHLGAPLNSGGNTSSRLSRLFNEAGYNSFQYICEQARKEKVDFIIIAGDLYDREARSVKAARVFVDRCQQLQEEDISVFVIAGNHDPLTGKKPSFTLPDNVNIFSGNEVEEKKYFSNSGRLQARLLGQSYRQKFESRSMYRYFTPEDERVSNLGLLHTQLDSRNNHYVPVAEKELLNKEGIHYWALGHIHSPRIINSSSPAIAYSGTPQGRNVTDTGLRGCFLVEMVSGEKPEITFLPTAEVLYCQLEIDINEMGGDYHSDEQSTPGINQSPENISELLTIMHKKAEKILKDLKNCRQQNETKKQVKQLLPELNRFTIEGKNIYNYFSRQFKGLIVRWVITGRGPLHGYIAEHRQEAVAEVVRALNEEFQAFNPFLWTHSVHFHTGHSLPEIENLCRQNEVFEEINQIVADLLNDSSLQDELCNSWGKVWQGSSEQEERLPQRFYPDAKTKERLIEEARQKILEELLERGEK